MHPHRHDLDTIVSNSETFNGPSHDITWDARALRDKFVRLMYGQSVDEIVLLGPRRTVPREKRNAAATFVRRHRTDLSPCHAIVASGAAGGAGDVRSRGPMEVRAQGDSGPRVRVPSLQQPKPRRQQQQQQQAGAAGGPGSGPGPAAAAVGLRAAGGSGGVGPAGQGQAALLPLPLPLPLQEQQLRPPPAGQGGALVPLAAPLQANTFGPMDWEVQPQQQQPQQQVMQGWGGLGPDVPGASLPAPGLALPSPQQVLQPPLPTVLPPPLGLPPYVQQQPQRQAMLQSQHHPQVLSPHAAISPSGRAVRAAARNAAHSTGRRRHVARVEEDDEEAADDSEDEYQVDVGGDYSEEYAEEEDSDSDSPRGGRRRQQQQQQRGARGQQRRRRQQQQQQQSVQVSILHRNLPTTLTLRSRTVMCATCLATACHTQRAPHLHNTYVKIPEQTNIRTTAKRFVCLYQLTALT